MHGLQLHPRIHAQVQWRQIRPGSIPRFPCCKSSDTGIVKHLCSCRRGAPYWEPSFATIAAYEEVAANRVEASVGSTKDGHGGEKAHAHATGTMNGHTANGLTNGHAADKDTDDVESHSSERPAAAGAWAPVAGAWQALRRQLLCSRAPPAVPELFRRAA